MDNKKPLPPLSRIRQAVDNDEPVGWCELKRWLGHLLNMVLRQTIKAAGGAANNCRFQAMGLF